MIATRVLSLDEAVALHGEYFDIEDDSVCGFNRRGIGCDYTDMVPDWFIVVTSDDVVVILDGIPRRVAVALGAAA